MKHTGTKQIETKRLLLRPFKPGDAEAMYRNWASEEIVTKFLTWPPHSSAKESKKIVDAWCEKNAEPDSYNWAIVLKERKELIGSIIAVRIDSRTASATIGYCLGSRWWGMGIMPEALDAVIGYLFDEVGMSCVNACHDPNNPNSGRVMKKCGMKYEGTWRRGGVNNQGVCDESWYSILKEEYDQRKKSMDEAIWEELYKKALSVQNGRSISPTIKVGAVAAALLTRAGNIYVGICIDTACSQGMCAERNAIANMLTHGECEIDRLVAIMPDGKTGFPCGACRELMMQLGKDSGEILILKDLETKQAVRLKELMPDWWGQA